MRSTGHAAFALAALFGCAQPPPFPLPFSVQVATVPDSVDQMLMQMELWRTRVGLSECLVDTSDRQRKARVNLVTLDLFVSPYGMVDSVAAGSLRATPDMLDCVRQVVRTWLLGEHPKPHRYRFTLPMSARLAEAEMGGPVEAEREVDRYMMRAITVFLYRSGQSMATCYLLARPIASPVSIPDYGGLVVMRFDVAPEGDILEARVVESTIRNPEVDSCLVRTVRTWTLPRNSGGAIEFPINFAPRQAPVQTSASLSR